MGFGGHRRQYRPVYINIEAPELTLHGPLLQHIIALDKLRSNVYMNDTEHQETDAKRKDRGTKKKKKEHKTATKTASQPQLATPFERCLPFSIFSQSQQCPSSASQSCVPGGRGLPCAREPLRALVESASSNEAFSYSWRSSRSSSSSVSRRRARRCGADGSTFFSRIESARVGAQPAVLGELPSYACTVMMYCQSSRAKYAHDRGNMVQMIDASLPRRPFDGRDSRGNLSRELNSRAKLA